jgi:PPOX class probable F420-dependent enzyme
MLLDKINEIVDLNHKAVFTTFRRNGAIQMSIVTVGVYGKGVAFTINRGSAKLANLRQNPRCSLMVSRSDWDDYAVLEGRAEVLSPDVTPAEELRLTLRGVYRAASGKEHPDWEEFDEALREDRRSAIIVVPEHIYYRN